MGTKNWAWYTLLIFLSIRLILNIELTPIFMIFAIIYLAFIIILIQNKINLVTSLITFLIIDSLIGTYFLTIKNLSINIYLGTVIVNIIIILILIKNPDKVFKN